MQLMLKNSPVLDISESGACKILDFDRLPFGMRREVLGFPDFVEWASNRTLSMGRSYAKEILNSLRFSQTNQYAVCKACRGLSLTDAYWIREEGDDKSWEDVNLFQNELSLYLAELALSGSNTYQKRDGRGLFSGGLAKKRLMIHTPELTTLGVSAKGWIRGKDGLWLHKVGRYELAASQILKTLGISHVSYEESGEEELRGYLSRERREWLAGVGERMVKSHVFTSEEISLVTFEEFSVFCESYGCSPYEEAVKVDKKAYRQMQIGDYLLNNDDRHGQNWGFFMENDTGKLTGYCPLFDHDHAFSTGRNVMSQTTEKEMTLWEAAVRAQEEEQLSLEGLFEMTRPESLGEEQWEAVLERGRRLRTCGNI